jgi:putative membrane protein insertion efficiency factor
MTGRQAGSLPARAAGALIWLYQRTVSPALVVIAGPYCGCRFEPTCSHYAAAALREHGLLAGLVLTVRRLARCAPWSAGGFDPVPPRRRLACTAVQRGA